MNKNILILISFIFLLTGFFNNSYAKNSFIFNDTLPKNSSATILEFNIERHCNDSIIQDTENKKIYLYGNANIKYGNIKITANKIVIDWKVNTILAIGTKDSIGNIIGNPVFKEGKESFKATEILYNLKSKKCIVKKMITKEGEGYIHGLKVKKLEDNILYLKKGEYTTCNAEKPHYSIRSNKIKLIPEGIIPFNLRKYGVSKKDLNYILKKSFTKERMTNNIMDLTEKDVSKILDEIY